MKFYVHVISHINLFNNWYYLFILISKENIDVKYSVFWFIFYFIEAKENDAKIMSQKKINSTAIN